MKANVQSALQTLLDVETAMLERWMATQERNAESMANDSETRRIVERADLGEGGRREPTTSRRRAAIKKLAE